MNVHSVDAKPVRHVAIIMDGNGRWAARRGLPRLLGHKKGAERVRDIVESCPELGVEYLTLFAFSTENWKRSDEEVTGLMALFRRYIQTESAKLLTQGARVRFIGDRTKLDPKLVAMMDGLEAKTAHNERVKLTVALNYGGRDEMMRAMQKMANAVARGELQPDQICESKIADYLDTAFLPDPDLVIRTSGEARISNFLLWQSAYAEYEFVETLWPEFSADEFSAILARCSTRERRYGSATG